MAHMLAYLKGLQEPNGYSGYTALGIGTTGALWYLIIGLITISCSARASHDVVLSLTKNWGDMRYARCDLAEVLAYALIHKYTYITTYPKGMLYNSNSILI